MEGAVRDNFKLHLPGLLKVLAEHLYASKTVAVRELLQNAHDSCVRRGVEDRSSEYRPAIDLFVDPRRGVLTISDNGAGLSRDDVTTYLATIGRSYTRELRERLALLSPDEAARLIGQFGFGFLSAFLIADDVTLTTRSHAADAEAVRWHCAGDESYEMGAGRREEPGTTIELRLKATAAFLLQRQLLIETVERYADFLPVPIYLGGDPIPINLMTPPWQATDVADATRDFIARRFGADEALCVIPLRDRRIELGHDALSIPMQGFLFVPPSSAMSVREWGDMTVFIRRMFIADDVRDLLPPWAKFVRGVVDCPALQPTASREDIHRDETFATVREALAAQLGAGLRDLARYHPQTWRTVVRAHTNVMVNWAAADDEFFRQVADIVTLRTTRGALTLPEYTALTGNTLYFVTQQLGSLQDALLAESNDVPAIEAAWIGVLPFLHKYANAHPGVTLVQMDGDSSRLLRPVPEAPFAPLLEVYRAKGIRARAAAFRPDVVPGIVLYPKGAELLAEGRDALARGELPAAMAGLVGGYLQSVSPPEQEGQVGTFYLNASCPLVRRLAEQNRPEDAAPGLWLIYHTARLFAGRLMSASDAAADYRGMVGALELLLK